MTTKTTLPEHDPAPDYEHTRRVHAETDNLMFVSYLPEEEYGFTRLIHFTNDGDSTGYIDIDGQTSRAFDQLTKLGEDNAFYYAQNTIYHHNDHIRRFVKKDLNSTEIDQLIRAKKKALAEANAKPPFTYEAQQEGRALRNAAIQAAHKPIPKAEERFHNLKWHTTMMNAAKNRVDNLTELQADKTTIANEQEKYEYHKQFADQLPTAEAELKQLRKAEHDAYVKSIKDYYEEAHAND